MLNIRFNLDDPTVYTTPRGFHVFTLWVNAWWGRLSAFADENDPASSFVTARPLHTVVNCEAAFGQARDWIDGCKYHEKCPEPKKAVLPTRVIEVSPERSPISPRLLESKGMTGSYAALSYCWGKDQPGVTTLKSLPSRLTQLDLRELSQTVRDAIRCARKLKMKYLWVDAVCIIQDSPDDRVRELASMRKVYENARVTIVAANSDSAIKGFLQDRPRAPSNYRVPFPCPNKQMGIVYLTHDGLKLSWHADEPIHTRAWTL
ncbi:heterokaryon incompatibility protein-domain-containing protein [Bisporella sp. PMI_857]|nr:heterokaryon incompatibility protein-domain-containing protein [Bisporella sp. PMI_857]